MSTPYQVKSQEMVCLRQMPILGLKEAFIEGILSLQKMGRIVSERMTALKK